MHSILCIASSESAGLAGLAVDLRVAAALGVHGAPIVAAVTAQPAQQAAQIAITEPALFRQQIQVALERLRPAAIKIGLVPGRAATEALLRALGDYDGPIVVDPVSSHPAGEFLAAAEWRAAIEMLLPVTRLLTPNLPEFRALTGPSEAESDEALALACAPLLRAGARAVLIKGGHRSGDADDLLVTTQGTRAYLGERLPGRFRGTGCALSSAIAAFLAKQRDLELAIEEARQFLRAAMAEPIVLADDTRLPHLFHEFYGREGLP